MWGVEAAAAGTLLFVDPLGAQIDGSDLLSLFTGATFLALAAVVLALSFNTRVNRAFALFLVLRGLLNLIGFLRRDATTVDLWERLYPYLGFAIPGVAVYFAMAYVDPHGGSRVHRWVGRVALLVTLAACVAYLVDHSWWIPLREPPWNRLELGRFLAYLGIALLFAFDHVRSMPGPQRVGLAVASVSFALYPVTYAANRLARGAIVSGEAMLVPFLVGVAVLGLYVWAAMRRNDPEMAAHGRRAAAVWLFVAVVGFILGSLFARGVPWADAMSGVMDSLTTLAQSLGVTYALARFQVFDLDLRLKENVRRATVGATFLAVYLLSAHVANITFGRAGILLGMAMAALLGVYVAPLNRLAGRVADAALPGVSDSSAYLNVRRLEVYRSALERVVAAGNVGVNAPHLAGLRRRLGLTERDHLVLLHSVRAGTMGVLPAGLHVGASVLGRYRIERALGEGSHGRTFLATTAEGRQVVLKVLHVGLDGADLLREAQAIASVKHARVVELLEVHHDVGGTVLVMEYMEGGSLRDRLVAGALAPPEFVKVAHGLLDALEAVHAAGVVHRDVKPSNVLLTRDAEAKLADFGIANLPGLEATIGPGHGDAVGTVPYMSPEQAKGKRVTSRSDLFSAAATLYEAWTGQAYLVAAPRESAIELQMRAAAAGPFRAPLDGPPALRRWFRRALDPVPERRFPDAAAMRTALLKALPGAIRPA